MECNNVCSILLKFGGCWTEVKGQNRMKYVGGNQKTLKFERSHINLLLLKEQTEAICQWIRGHAYDLHYHISGTSPKMYMPIKSENDVIDMLLGSRNVNKVEVVVVVIDHQEGMIYTDETQRGCVQDVSATNTVNNDILVDGLYDASFVGGVEETNILCVGSRFEDSSSFKQAIRSNAILQNFAIRIKASDKSRVIATCTYRGCPWRIRASLCSDGHSFEVRKLLSTHLCPGVNRAGNKQATSSWIAHEIQDIVKRNPDVTPKDIGNNLETTFGLSLPYMKIWRSRELAREQMFGSVDDNYKWVPTLRSELLNRNPGSHITYQCDKQNGSFKRFFVSFKVCIDGFLAGCRYLIGIDACHLKSKYLGVLLSANSLDGNNGLFNIAFAVAESESKKSWEWFLMNLSQSFDVHIEHLAFISDMEKGLGEAIKTVFPHAEHRLT
ncbi:uncharacterized protein LOC110108909 [Dendrobium catenatum]|uniref:uncharacterized protein LOC110108909 n=1 Tax=Dendrobium catenatum TaxID=906689 RepID=UPI00109F89A8|nr:uncharacterized protein LOC110108909 [Dendrobium catenatum]